MNIVFRAIFKILLVTIFLGAVGFGLFVAYECAVDNAVQRVRAGVTKGLFDVINPLRWPRKIFGK